MKLVFLCTSLAPGRDGVGDYVRQLAAACAQLGHVCLLVALHDRNLSPTAALLQRANEVRFSAGLSWKRRAAMLASLLRDFDPHWISWQLVPFGFHPKGIMPVGAFALAEAARGRRNHVLLHELWVGIARDDRLKLRLLGAMQRRRLLAFLNRLGPSALHTTNQAYRFALAHEGWPADVLPLFGNMPVVTVKPYRAAAELTDLVGRNLPPPPRWTGVIFGTIHPQWKPEPTLAWLRQAATAAHRPIGLVALGRAGAHGERWLASAVNRHGAIPIVAGGPQTPERISCLLQAADFGIATHPWALIGKSGTAATLLEHGLPVLVPRDDWRSRHGPNDTLEDALLTRMQDLEPAAFANWLAQRRPPASRVPAVAAQFLAELDRTPAGGALVA